MNGSGISQLEPNPDDYEDQEDFEFSWNEWMIEYPEAYKRAMKYAESN